VQVNNGTPAKARPTDASQHQNHSFHHTRLSSYTHLVKKHPQAASRMAPYDFMEDIAQHEERNNLRQSKKVEPLLNSLGTWFDAGENQDFSAQIRH